MTGLAMPVAVPPIAGMFPVEILPVTDAPAAVDSTPFVSLLDLFFPRPECVEVIEPEDGRAAIKPQRIAPPELIAEAVVRSMLAAPPVGLVVSEDTPEAPAPSDIPVHAERDAAEIEPPEVPVAVPEQPVASAPVPAGLPSIQQNPDAVKAPVSTARIDAPRIVAVEVEAAATQAPRQARGEPEAPVAFVLQISPKPQEETLQPASAPPELPEPPKPRPAAKPMPSDPTAGAITPKIASEESQGAAPDRHAPKEDAEPERKLSRSSERRPIPVVLAPVRVESVEPVSPLVPSPFHAALRPAPALVSSPAPGAPARPPEPAAEVPSIETRPRAVKEVAVRLSPPDAKPVDVHLADRGGEIRVSVRAADIGMRSALQQDLHSLVNRLQETGLRTEAFVPSEARLTRLEPAGRPSLEAVAGVPFQSEATFRDAGSSESQRDVPDRGQQQQPDSRQQQRRQNPQQQRNWKFATEDLT